MLNRHLRWMVVSLPTADNLTGLEHNGKGKGNSRTQSIEDESCSSTASRVLPKAGNESESLRNLIEISCLA